MTCRHVLDLIDAGPFAGVPREHLEAACQHVRHCTSCGAALEASKALTTELASLPHPAASPELAATVLARIARIEQDHGASAARSIGLNPAPTRDWSAWATAGGGVAAELATVLSTPLGHAVLSDIIPLRVGVTAGGGAMPLATTSAVVLGAALVLYAAGLFASLSGGRRP